tara:strand:- start:90 stop:260 length:171 start_codon:yes stop_codon:yes gene_type:complete
VFIVVTVDTIVYGLLNILYALPTGEGVREVKGVVMVFILIGGLKNSTDVVVLLNTT